MNTILVYIYYIQCIITRKAYVGKGKTYNRANQHFRKSSNKELREDVKKYGKENFVVRILERCEEEIWTEREKYWIEELNVYKGFGYNKHPGGHGGDKPSHIWNYQNEVIKLYKEGMSTPKIAKKYRASIPVVYKLLKENGIKFRPTQQKNPAWKYEKEIVEMYNKGKSTIQIASKYETYPAIIRKILKVNNVILRPSSIPGRKVKRR